ncbi:hypothetical protein CKAH01_10292 [Colletotrichum kahawae]|uniref:Uncharacterized protein n=1 Tax=Colletotrichum kahawae TaxID=34407 RepID=A0AAD9XZC5_COLKA|nr:hypothetical protein CKAH01_10292 [Colletotrichum kahawae]
MPKTGGQEHQGRGGKQLGNARDTVNGRGEEGRNRGLGR